MIFKSQLAPPRVELIKLLRVMKLTAIILLAACITASANGYSQKVTISEKDAPLEKVFKEIKKQTGYVFFYDEAWMKQAKKVSVNVIDYPLEDVLKICFKNQPLTFSIVGTTVVLKQGVASIAVNETNEIQKNTAPPFTVTGKVVDEEGKPLQNVSVILKSTGKGGSSDANGNFSIQVPENGDVLIVSYVGFEVYQTKLSKATTLNIVLKLKENNSEAVVVIGYGTQKKKDVTGSTASVSAAEIMQTPVMGIDQALTGRLSGVQVIQSNGAPGGALQVQVRGIGGLNGGSSTQPLYVIDGVPIFSNDGELNNAEGFRGDGSAASNPNASSPLANINPNDIESIDVLKDASATAIYGSRAANGVVIVTTKSGKAGKTKVNFDVYTGIQKVRNKYDLLNASEALALSNERNFNNRTAAGSANNVSFNPYTYSEFNKSYDWQDIMFTTGKITDANLSLSGGTQDAKFSSSINYFNNKGIVVNSDVSRVSLRLNLDGTPFKKITYGIRTSFSYQWGSSITDNDPNSSIVTRIYESRPFQPGLLPDGSYYGPPARGGIWDALNPYYEALETQRDNEKRRFNGNVFVEYAIVKNLKFKSLLGIDYNDLYQHFATIPIARGLSGETNMYGNFNQLGRVFDNATRTSNWVADQTLTYQAVLGKNHRINAVAGFSAQNNNIVNGLARVDGSLNVLLNQVSNGSTISQVRGSNIKQGLVSQFIRTNYSFNNRYLFTGTIRRDGSSKFGPNNRYGIFPSASVGWRISEEPFFIKNNFLSDLKIRASWGLTGNQNIGDFAFISRIVSTPYAFGNAVADGQSPANISNPNLKWESNEQIDIGVDLALLKGRYSFTADYFRKRSTGLLYNIPLPLSSGFTNNLVNLGQVENSGLELALRGTLIQKKDFKWNFSYNMTFLRNKVLDLGVNERGESNIINPGVVGLGNSVNSDASPTIIKAGLPIGAFIGYRQIGIYQNQAEIDKSPKLTGTTSTPGDIKYADTNGDGIIDQNDRVILGNPFPDFFGGLSTDFSYKNFSVNVVASFTVGNDIYNLARQRFESSVLGGFKEQLNRWTGEGTSNVVARISAQNYAANRNVSDRYVEDGSFFKIRTVTLVYKLPTYMIKTLKMGSASIFASVSNFAVFTNYSGQDPEVSSNGGNAARGGFDAAQYPNPITLNAGFKIGL